MMPVVGGELHGGAGRFPASRSRIWASRAAGAVRCRAWRSSRSGAGTAGTPAARAVGLGLIEGALEGAAGPGGQRLAN
jgi:hypothetical protein